MPFTFKPYHKRTIRFRGTPPYDDWKFKQYSISAYNENAPAVLFEAATPHIRELLPPQAVNATRYGVGFIIVHEACDGNYLLVSWWEGENMLCHHVLGAASDTPLHFKSIKDSGIIACVWELEILYFEKKLWSEKILMQPGQPDFDTYLSAGFSGNI